MKIIEKTLDTVDASSGLLTLINPIFATIPIFIFATKEIMGYTNDNDIVKRMKKIEKKLLNKKININEFESKVKTLSEHNYYVVKNNLKNILSSCIPETVDIYISLWIDLIMEEKNSIYELLCEKINEMNKNDILLLKKIKEYTIYGKNEYYIQSEIDISKENQKIDEENKKIREYNKKTKGIKKIEAGFRSRDARIKNQTIFWKDFASYYNLNPCDMSYILLLGKDNNNKIPEWTFIINSFNKLKDLDILQLEYFNTLRTINSLNIERFHITIFGEKLLEYIFLNK